jgi:dihydroxyacetone kinase
MQAKHFLPDSDTLLSSSLYANTLLNPSVALDPVSKTIYRRPNYPAQVELLTGGGSGHEPAFTGYVGAGILSATVAGTIFASPSAKQVQGALSLLNSEDSKRKGTLVIVMNYTGDVLNFGLGVEKARAKGDKVDFVIVGDDCGVGRKAGGKVGRRGIAGTVLVVKIAGALAQAGADLETCKRVAELVQSNVLSVGASLEHVHVPGREKVQETSLAEGVVEVGMGIHNEEGAEKVKMNLQQLVERMLGMMLDKKDTDRAFLDWSPQDEWVLMINNLGGVSGLEMGGLVAEVSRQLQEPWRIKPKRTLSGTYITSLNGNGFSISLLRLQDTELGAKMSMLDLIEAPAETMGWTNPVQRETWERNDSEIVRKRKDTGQEETEPSNAKINVDLAKTALITGLEHAIAAEAEITKYDTIVGDGDCGIGLKRGAEGK